MRVADGWLINHLHDKFRFDAIQEVSVIVDETLLAFERGRLVHLTQWRENVTVAARCRNVNDERSEIRALRISFCRQVPYGCSYDFAHLRLPKM